MKFVFLFGLLAIENIYSAVAQKSDRILDPEIDFINNSLTYKNSSQKSFIVRREIDLFDTGYPVIFLRSSVGGGKCGEYWTAYFPNQGHGYKRFADIEFREDTFRAGKIPIYNPAGGMLAYYPGEKGGELIRIQFEDNQVKSEIVRSLDFKKEEDQKVFFDIFGRKPSDLLDK